MLLTGQKSDFSFDGRHLGQIFLDNVDKFSDRICQIDAVTKQEETFHSVKTRSIRCAIEMKKRGIKQNDVILICSKLNCDILIVYLAGFYLGAKLSFLDCRLTKSTINHAFNLVSPSWIFAGPEVLHLIEDFEANIVVFEDEDTKYSSFSEFLKQSPEEEKFQPTNIIGKNDTAIIFFSSGTTGSPKGICITYYGMQHSTYSICQFVEKNPIPIRMHFSSYYWISSVAPLMVCLKYGSTIVFHPSLNDKTFLSVIEEYKIFFAMVSPLLALHASQLPEAQTCDTSSLKILILGGTALTPANLAAIRKVFNKTGVSFSYGQTEAGGGITLHNDYLEYLKKPASVGKVGGDVIMKIVDVETRKILGPNQKGEICYKLDFGMSGYYNMDSSDAYDEDGFFKSGDLGYYDEDQYIYVVDRLSEMFKSKFGWQVVPTTIEAVLNEHPDVQESVVFGVQHETENYRPGACVKLNEGASVSVEELYDLVAEKMSEWCRLTAGIKIVDHIFKTPTDKVKRNVMRDLFINGK